MNGITLTCGIRVPVCILSPMEGIMSSAFVRTVRALHLADFWIPPFISVTGGSVPSRRILKKRLLPFTETGDPVIPQILGKDPDSLLRCTDHLAELGFRSVNVNFCCPSPRVTSHGAGSRLLENPETLRQILTAWKDRFPGMSLSVKLRSGWEKDRTEEIIHAVRDGGAEWIIFHFRTGREMYGPVSGGLFRTERAVRAAGSIPLYGNGDIQSAADAEKYRVIGCSGTAAARGFFADPDLIRKICGTAPSGVTSEQFRNRMQESGAAVSLLRKLQRLESAR